MESGFMQIGALAEQAGVNVQTVRYYERRGLLRRPTRTDGGFRVFPRETVAVIRFVKRAQDLGFTLEEIQELLRLREDRVSPCADVRAVAESKIANIDRRIEGLTAIRHALTTLVAACRRNRTKRECPILEALDETVALRRDS